MCIAAALGTIGLAGISFFRPLVYDEAWQAPTHIVMSLSSC